MAREQIVVGFRDMHGESRIYHVTFDEGKSADYQVARELLIESVPNSRPVLAVVQPRVIA